MKPDSPEGERARDEGKKDKQTDCEINENHRLIEKKETSFKIR